MGLSTRWRATLAFGAAALALVAGIDVLGPRSHDLRAFEPGDVARLETNMWRSYYTRDRLQLFGQLAALLRSQYGFPPLRSFVTAFYAARAAAVFQAGHARADYEKALPYLDRFYRAIKAVSTRNFDAARAARLELEWWIIHRERSTHTTDDLRDALAALQAELYGLPAQAFADHASDRASAMLLRDTAAEHGGPTNAEWVEIGGMLQRSWRAHWQAVQAVDLRSVR